MTNALFKKIEQVASLDALLISNLRIKLIYEHAFYKY